MSKGTKRQSRKNRHRAGKRLRAQKLAALQARLRRVQNRLEINPISPRTHSSPEPDASSSTTSDHTRDYQPFSTHGVEREVIQTITRIDEGLLYEQIDIRRKILAVPNVDDFQDDLQDNFQNDPEVIILNIGPEIITLD